MKIMVLGFGGSTNKDAIRWREATATRNQKATSCKGTRKPLKALPLANPLDLLMNPRATPRFSTGHPGDLDNAGADQQLGRR